MPKSAAQIEQPPKPLKWSAAHEQALRLVFEGRWSQAAIAKNCDVSPRTLWTWTQHPDFQQRLEALRADFAASIREEVYADKARRVVALSQMAEAARVEFEARPWLKEVRPTADGEITNESFNRDAHAAFRGALDDIAKELGERKNITELSGKDGKPIEISDARQRLAIKLATLAERRRTAGTAQQPD
jgi:hypothetical protein